MLQVLLYVEGTIYQLDEDNERRQLATTGSSRTRTGAHEDNERRQLATTADSSRTGTRPNEDSERRQLATTADSSRTGTRPNEDSERRQPPAASGAHAPEGLGEDTERRLARDSDGSGGDADGKGAEGDSDSRRAADVHVAAGREAAAAAGPAERKAEDVLAGPETGRAWESLVGVLR